MPRITEQVRLSGVVKDLSPIDVGPTFYTDAENMIARDGYMQRIGGLADVFGNPTGPPVWLLPVLTPLVSFWVYATELAGVDGIGVTDGLNHDDITPVALIDTNNRQNAWTGGLLNGVPVLNPGFSEPVFWDTVPANPCTILPGWPAGDSCLALRPYLNYLCAMNYTPSGGPQIPEQVRWSDSADPGFLPTAWSPLPDNDAGDLSLAETPGAVVDGLGLRQSFIVYKNSSTFAMDFVGGQFIWGQRLLFSTTGVLSRNCAAEFRGNHAVLTDGDFVIHDGNEMRSVIDAQMRRFIFDNISADNFSRAFVAHNKTKSEIWICFPRGAEIFPTLAVVWSYEDNKFGVRDLYDTPHAANGITPALAAALPTWANQVASWQTAANKWNQTNFNPSADGLILADPGEGFYQVDVGSDFAGVPIVGLIERDSLDLGDAAQVKTVRSIWPRVNGVSGDTISIAVGAQMNQSDPISFSPSQDYVIGTDEKIDTFAVGRLISVRMASNNGQSWRTSGFDIEFGTASNY